jgi:hypothetical protein
MPSISHDLTNRPWRTVVEGVAAFIVLASLVGGLAAAATWGLVQAVGALVP